jgi:glycosyltransferase involved in cell wall biosynthesis
MTPAPSPFPYVTIAVPTRNEEATIRQCLEAIVAQSLPRDRFEIIVLDGRSTDGTRAIVEEVANEADVPIRLLDNAQRSIPAALNRAIEAAQGEYLVRVDGHSAPGADYVRRSVEGNIELDADLAGGWVEAVGTTKFGRAVAVAFASPVAMGNASSWRPPLAPREVVSVPCGSYRIESLRRIGGFDEAQHANQDYEANYRLRRAGGRAVLLPDVHFRYVTRSTPWALARQLARYGYYKARVMIKHPESIRPRHLAPQAFVAVTALAAVAAAVEPAAIWLLVALVAVYIVMLLVATAWAVRRNGPIALLLPVVLPTMHFSWVAGNLFGLVRWLPQRASAPATRVGRVR